MLSSLSRRRRRITNQQGPELTEPKFFHRPDTVFRASELALLDLWTSNEGRPHVDLLCAHKKREDFRVKKITLKPRTWLHGLIAD